jgi:hypothetical protein
MKKKRMYWCVAAISGVVVLVWLAFEQATTPRSKNGPVVSNAHDEDELVLPVDFGELASSTVAKQEFRMRNTSGTEWILKRVQTSCGCTSCKIRDTSIAPGEELVGVLTVRTPDRAGRFASKALLELENGIPTIQVKATAVLVQYLSADPPSVAIEFSDKDALSLKRKLTISASKDIVGEMNVSGSSSWCHVVRTDETAADAADRREWHFEIQSSAGEMPALAEVSTRLQFSVGDDPRARVFVPVLAKIHAAVSPSPSQFYFGRMGVGESRSARVVLSFAKELPEGALPTVVVGPTLEGLISTEMKPLNERHYLITAKLKPNDPRVVRGNIVVAADQHGIEAMIPVFAIVDEPRAGSAAIESEKHSLLKN